jgi:hypothetical protein
MYYRKTKWLEEREEKRMDSHIGEGDSGNNKLLFYIYTLLNG